MEEIIFLPMWANIAAIAAVLILCFAAWGEKIKNVVSHPNGYYAVTSVVSVALATVFFLISPEPECVWGLMIACGAILFIGFVVCLFACAIGDQGIASIAIPIGLCVAACIIFTVLLYTNVTYAAIWGGTVMTLLLIGKLLAKKK